MSYTLSEHEAKQLLSEVGIPIPPETLVCDAEAAVAAAHALGLPAVVKLCGRKIAHKTERDLVRLNLQSEESVRAAAVEILAKRRSDEADCSLLVQAMAHGRRELIAGMVRDPQFGPSIMFGLGGIFTEAVGDVAFALAPLAAGDAEDLVSALRYGKVLGEFRGEPAVDLEALVTILEGLSRLGTERKDIRSIDINPLVVQGSTPIVVDALVEIEGDAQ